MTAHERVAAVLNDGRRFPVADTDERDALLDAAPLNTLRFFHDGDDLWVERND